MYIYLYIYHKYQPNVGKYTSPMDPMGIKLIWHAKTQALSGTQHLFLLYKLVDMFEAYLSCWQLRRLQLLARTLAGKGTSRRWTVQDQLSILSNCSLNVGNCNNRNNKTLWSNGPKQTTTAMNHNQPAASTDQGPTTRVQQSKAFLFWYQMWHVTEHISTITITFNWISTSIAGIGLMCVA